MKTFFSTLFFTLIFLNINAQNAYFQQEVNYTIDVTLNDSDHTLKGNIQMEYTNNSSDDLTFIYLHLWPNAYKNTSTAFCKQKLRTGDDEFYFSDKKTRGKISGLDFSVDGKKTALEMDQTHPDIAKLILNEPLKAGKTITISGPFEVKIPASYSRLGHVKQSYQMTQWYPKPAVYDQNGWHQMPYLDMGEFYSEFSSFDVTITLPENYVVGATGILQTESEKAFLQSKIEETNAYFDTLKNAVTRYGQNPFPVSSSTMKTIRYTAENVHDFGWFADKRFKVRKGEVTLASGKKVDTWVMFTKTNEAYWEDAVDYVGRSVKYYSDQVGEYPYPHATAVQSALSAGGGMEYPMITVIGWTGSKKSLDEVITHEVGHNWFYGILASNERDHAWMDEGLNSFYEQRYMTEYYGSAEDFNVIPDFIMKDSEMGLFELAYLFFKRKQKSQAPDTPSDDFYAPNYLIGAYLKPPVVLRYLEASVGLDKFDKAMQTYYSKWKFKHPQPADFQKVMEEELGTSLDWIFKGLLLSDDHIDYALTGMEEKSNKLLVDVKNKGKVTGPYSISGMKDTSVVTTQWYDGVEDKTTVTFPKGDYDLLVLDQMRRVPDLYRKNNNLKTEGLFKKWEPVNLKFLIGVDDDKRSSVYYLPLPAYNVYDGFMLGAAFYNTAILTKRFQFRILPMYAFKSQSLAGVGDISYTFPVEKVLRNIKVGLNARRFHHFENEAHNYNLSYNRINPYVDFNFDNNLADSKTQKLSLKAIIIDHEIAKYDGGSGSFTGVRSEQPSYIFQMIYTLGNRRIVNPFGFQVGLEGNKMYRELNRERHIKAWAAVQSAYTYASGRNINFRLFAGGFIENPSKDLLSFTPDAFNLSSFGINDYRLNDFYFGRNENTGLWSNQIGGGEGGMKLPFGASYPTGRSNRFIVSVNLKADLPKKMIRNIPVKPYFDMGYYQTSDDGFNSENILWSGGLMLELLGGRIEAYFPIANSKNINDRFTEKGNYFSRVGFKIDLANTNPWDLVEEVLVP